MVNWCDHRKITYCRCHQPAFCNDLLPMRHQVLLRGRKLFPAPGRGDWPSYQRIRTVELRGSGFRSSSGNEENKTVPSEVGRQPDSTNRSAAGLEIIAPNNNSTTFNNFEPLRTHQFDTFKFVSALEKAGYSHSQAVALMKCLRTVLVNGTEFAKSHYLSRGDLENVSLPQIVHGLRFKETYLFRAAMSELRAEVKTLRHNEVAAERADVIALQKELDALNEKTREDIENLRNDVTIEMNNRKIATRAEQQAMESKIQDLSYNFTKRLADMRTEAEAQKWQTTRLLIGANTIGACLP